MKKCTQWYAITTINPFHLYLHLNHRKNRNYSKKIMEILENIRFVKEFLSLSVYWCVFFPTNRDSWLFPNSVAHDYCKYPARNSQRRPAQQIHSSACWKFGKRWKSEIQNVHTTIALAHPLRLFLSSYSPLSRI
jgi:hypothetical protein